MRIYKFSKQVQKLEVIFAAKKDCFFIVTLVVNVADIIRNYLHGFKIGAISVFSARFRGRKSVVLWNRLAIRLIVLNFDRYCFSGDCCAVLHRLDCGGLTAVRCPPVVIVPMGVEIVSVVFSSIQ